MTDKRLYWVWAAMLDRCRNPNNKQYKDYGGRGIKTCERWLSFDNFAADMGTPGEGMTLDRRDNDGDYEQKNCQWVPRSVQNANRRNCIYVDDSGERVTLKEYCRRHDLRYRPIVKRIRDRGWPIKLALCAPMGTRRSRHNG
jgi:hypothetical protein